MDNKKLTLIEIARREYDNYLNAINDLAEYLDITNEDAEEMIAGDWIETNTGHRDRQSTTQ